MKSGPKKSSDMRKQEFGEENFPSMTQKASWLETVLMLIRGPNKHKAPKLREDLSDRQYKGSDLF